MTKESKTYYNSPIGVLEIIGSLDGIIAISFAKQVDIFTDVPVCLQECIRQLDEYFSGIRKNFDLALDVAGTAFQLKVWKALSEVSYGKIVSYKDIANLVGNEKAVRAVGNANHNNPVPIIVPCHRVVGAKGDLIGYAGGLWRKKWLIEHEAKYLNS